MATTTRSTIRFGSRGADVTAWQNIIDVTRDGIFGVNTEIRTRAWQEQHGLQADGIVGPKTWAKAGVTCISPPVENATSQDIRDALVGLAEATVGLGAAAKTREQYLDAIIPSPADRANPNTCRDMAGMSGCALLVRGIWHRAGCKHPILTAPYRYSKAVSDVVQIAKEADALRDRSATPNPGDVVVVDDPTHVFTVISMEGSTVHSVDGGQKDGAGLQTITRRSRKQSQRSGRIYWDNRPVLYLIDSVRAVLAKRG